MSALPQLAYERRGTGEPLVLVHGLGSRRQVWQPILDALAAHHDVIAVDLPGFGASALDDTAPTVEGFADRIEAFLAELGVDRPHVAGNSMGAGIALELGRRGVARSVTAFAPIGFWRASGRRWCQQLLTAMRTLARAIGPAAPALTAIAPTRAVLYGAFFGRPWQLERDYALGNVEGLLGATGFAPARDAFTGHRFDGSDPGKLPGIPVTVAWGTRDVILTYASQHRRARVALPDAAHLALPGCGHLPFADDPALCARVLLDTTTGRQTVITA